MLLLLVAMPHNCPPLPTLPALRRPLFNQFGNPEQLYQHLESLRSGMGSSSSEEPAVPPLQQQLCRLPVGTPPEALAVLEACLHVDPQQRATADQLLAMPFFRADLLAEMPC
jgi:serine/threonine protein kinase